jgi:hypothetical protein
MKRGAWGGVLLGLVVSGGFAGTGEKTMGYPNYQKSADSPPVADADRSAIAAAFVGGKARITFTQDEPWALFGTYRLQRELLAELGDRPDSHILLVVRHRDSPAIHTCRVLRDDLPPKPVPNTVEQGGRMLSRTGYFSVDLKAQCRMQPQTGKYWVVALMGPLSTPVLEFEVKP